MKLKFQIKQKDNSFSHASTFNSMAEGDAWVGQNALAFGRPDLSLKAGQLEQHGLQVSDASSTSTDPVDGQTVYHFPKEWSVEVVDITAELETEEKVQDRSESRQQCLKVVDFIASYNKDEATPEQMSAIFSNPAFVGIVLALLTGAPRTAEALVSQHGPSLYPQVMVDKVLAMLGAIE